MKKEGILLKQILEEAETLVDETQTDPMEGAIKHALNRIYTEILPLPQTLPTLIFGENHTDPATSKIISKLIERLASMNHSFSFYEELSDPSEREHFLKLSRIEMETGEDPLAYKSEEEKRLDTTTAASRESKVKMDDTFLSHNIPVECVDDHLGRERFLQLVKDPSSDLRNSDALILRDDSMAAHYLTGHGVIGLVGLNHFEGIQKRIQAQFISAKKESMAGSNYCFFNIYSGSSEVESKFFKEASLPFPVTRINLDEMSEDDAVELILNTIKKAQEEMQIKGYWRSAELLPEKNPDTIISLKREIRSTGHSETKDEKTTPILPLSPEDLTSVFKNPGINRKELLSLLKNGHCPQILPDKFKQFLILEALAGRFEFLLLLKDPPVNFIFAKTTLLHAAIAADRSDVVNFLLEHNHPINVQNSKGMTPLHIAAKNSNSTVIHWLVNRGAKMNLTDNNGLTATDVSSPYIKNMITEIQQNLNKIAYHIVRQPQPSENALIILFSNPDKLKEEIALMLKKGFCPKVLPENFKEFLVREALAGRYEILLLLKNPPVNFTYGKNTLLHVAVAANRLDVVNFLLKFKPPLDAPSFLGMTPLHLAAKNGNTTIIQWLLDRGARTNQCNNKGLTADDIAAPSVKGLIPKIRENMQKLKDKRPQSIFAQTQKPSGENSFTAPSPGLSG